MSLRAEHNAPRIKLYRDKATGMLKGDGLVTYLKASGGLTRTSVSVYVQSSIFKRARDGFF